MSNLEWAVIWSVCAIIAWVIAARKGHSGFIFFVTSVCLTPLVGVTAAIIAKRRKISRKLKRTAAIPQPKDGSSDI